MNPEISIVVPTLDNFQDFYLLLNNINQQTLLPKEIVIDECIRLSKKFSSPDSYKFINVYLDKYLKLNKAMEGK